MRVSVVLCTYSHDRYGDFQDAAESILSQTYDDIELVIVVDGKTTVYERVLDDYGDKNRTQISCNDENLGLLESRNRGAEIADGNIVAFIDDDAIADQDWVKELVKGYEERNAVAVGGKMTAEWVAGKPEFLPEEFYWLVGVTHRGFADGPGYVRNTFGSNISFRRDIFLELGGFDIDIGGRKGDKNLQGGETELCARLAVEYDERVWYTPDAKVAHKVFDYRTDPSWLLDRAFWQGYSKRAMEELLETNDGDEEDVFLRRLAVEFFPGRLADLVRSPSLPKAKQLVMLLVFTAFVGSGYLYGLVRY
ncbi:glucosyl-dolichyl phosphate glucuronosyltransferase [Natronomonas amylolytica]|uniref:glucosyl-dolichyl phosphate glucuronosyltransferase n=1 Tax=Natronomonas amylolytica TaxID=3108498 RepID=UPI00300AEBCC